MKDIDYKSISPRQIKKDLEEYNKKYPITSWSKINEEISQYTRPSFKDVYGYQPYADEETGILYAKEN